MAPGTRSRTGRDLKMGEITEDVIVISSDDEESSDRRGNCTSPRRLAIQDLNCTRATPKTKSPRSGESRVFQCDSPRAIERLSHEKERISSRLNEIRIELRKVKKENSQLIAQNRRLQSETCSEVFRQLHSSVVCEICEDYLWDPYLLIPCGHTACRGCIVKWFNTITNKDPELTHLHCPKCRQLVEHKPTPNYSLKSLIQIITPIVYSNANLPPVGMPNDAAWTRFQKFFH